MHWCQLNVVLQVQCQEILGILQVIMLAAVPGAREPGYFACTTT